MVLDFLHSSCNWLCVKSQYGISVLNKSVRFRIRIIVPHCLLIVSLHLFGVFTQGLWHDVVLLGLVEYEVHNQDSYTFALSVG